MAISHFIPTVWSENLSRALDKKYVAVANCNREFEGEIRSAGDRVKICGINPVNIFDYTKNTDMGYADPLIDNAQVLIINQAKAFNFQIDDIDRAQANPKLMSEAMRLAAAGLANTADRFIYNLYTGAGKTEKVDDVTEENIIDTVIKARTTLLENNVSDSDDIVIEVSPAIAALIFKGKLAYSGDTILESGCIGNLCGCKVFVSNNIATSSGSGVTYHKCLMRTKRAIAFAEQLSEVDAYRPEKRFADAVKGLHLYGAKVVYPNEMVLLDLGVKTA